MPTNRTSGESGLVSASHGAPAGLDGPAMREWAEELVARARAEGLDLTGEGGLLTGLIRQVLQTGLEVELAEHLGYEAYDPAGRGSGNNRNGSYAKTVATEVGDVELRVPRDRNGTFEPVTVPKHTRRLDGLNGNVISLYCQGTHDGRHPSPPARDLRHRDLPGDDFEDHRRRGGRHAGLAKPAARRVYAVLVIDAIVIKVRDSQVANRSVYVVIGVNMDGERDVLGLWLGPAGGEGAKQ